jgi:hypothetical protein
MVNIRPGKISSVIHENRHTRQSFYMTTCQREIEAFTIQSIFSPSDLNDRINNARNDKYPPGSYDPSLLPVWGIKEMVEDVYNCK